MSIIEEIENVVSEELLFKIINEFHLSHDDIHGINHWSRVLSNGFAISEKNGANRNVLIAFSFFHDSKRRSEGKDADHGYRGAEFLKENVSLTKLTEKEFKKAYFACFGHTDIKFSSDMDIATCWDADRLDLMRAFIYPEKKYLNNIDIITDDFIKERSAKAEYDTVPYWVTELKEKYISMNSV